MFPPTNKLPSEYKPANEPVPLELTAPEAVTCDVTFRLPLAFISSPSLAPTVKNVLCSDRTWKPPSVW